MPFIRHFKPTSLDFLKPLTVIFTPLQSFRITITLCNTSLLAIIQTLRSVNVKCLWWHVTFPPPSLQLRVFFMSIMSQPHRVPLVHRHTFSLDHIPPDEPCSDSTSIPSLTLPPDLTEFLFPTVGNPPFILLSLSVYFLSGSLSLSFSI